ncbi:MAG TPA: MFS transporter [Sphingobium sp.]|uniref:MFS transporter n=1 Tax=Sphingobium sp. TaxID=1912891 RepID=UPI002ED3E045
MATGGMSATGMVATPAATVDGLPLPRRYVAIAALSMGTIVTTVDGSIVNVALPTLARDLHVEPSAAVLMVTVYQLIMMMALLPFAALGERIGLRRLYQYGLMVFLAATILCFFAKSLPFLILVRAFQSMGAAAVLAVASAMIRIVYPSSQLGRGLSLNTVIAATAASFAPSIGGIILGIAPWNWLFAMLAPFAVLSIFLGRNSLPEPVARDEPYDVLGAVMCAATFGFTIFGLESGLHGDSPIISAAIGTLGIGIGFVFVRRELEQTRPTLPIDLLRNRTISLSTMSLFAVYMASMVIMLTLPFRLQQQFHFTPVEAGAMIAPWPLVAMVVAPTSGLLSDRTPAGLLGAIGMAIATASLVALAFLPDSPSYFDLLWRVSLSGVGFGMFYSPTTRQLVGAAPVDRTAAAGGLTSTTRGAGQTFGSTVVAALIATGHGVGPAASLIGAGLSVIGVLCSVAVYGAIVRSERIEDLPDI